MDQVDVPLSAASIASLEAVAVANITNPTELNSIAGTTVGERRVCYQVVAADNIYTVYYWDSADSSGASAPYVMAGSSGFWIATAGRYVNSAVSMRSTLDTTGTATLATVVTNGNATVGAGRVTLTNSGSTASIPFLLLDDYGSAGRVIRLRNPGLGTKYNFQLDAQLLIDNGFAITPSTAVGGSTFSTASIAVFGATGNVAIGKNTDDGTNKFQVTGSAAISTDATVTGGLSVGASATAPTSGIIFLSRSSGANLSLQTAGVTQAQVRVTGTNTVSITDSSASAFLSVNTTAATGTVTVSANAAALNVNSAAVSLSTAVGAVNLAGGIHFPSRSNIVERTFGGGGGVYRSLFLGSTGTTANTDASTVALNVDVNAVAGTTFVGDGSEIITKNVITWRQLTAAGTDYLGSTAMQFDNGKLLVRDTTASTTTATGAVTVAGGVGIAGAFNAGASSSIVASSGAAVLTLTGAAANESRLRMNGGTAHYNWQVAPNANVNQAFEITPSTATGGSTFSTPALLVFGATGNVVIGTTTDDGTNRLQVAGTVAFTNSGSGRVITAAQTNSVGYTAATSSSWIGARYNNAATTSGAAIGFEFNVAGNQIAGVAGVREAVTSDTGHLAFLTSSGGTYGERGRFTSGGNLLLGTTTDDGTNKLQVSGALSVNSATMIATKTNFTNGAAAAAGTLLNAPAAGNPTKWIPINDNGTTRYIPAW